jgi:hypothetical protein
MMNDQKPIPDYYHFYEQVNTNGLKYDILIDNAIINQLKDTETSPSGKLKHATELLVGRRLSPDTFYGHTNVLTSCKILVKKDGGRGKDVIYSLSENAKRLLQLNLLGEDWEKIRSFNMIYERFFLSELVNDPSLLLRTENEFDSFLSELGVKRESLDWGAESTAEYGDSLGLINENTKVPESLRRKNVKEYWQEKEGQTTVYDHLVFVCFPKRPHNLDIVVYRVEQWQINRNSPNKLLGREYTAIIPGVSIEDVANGRTPKFGYIDVEKAFDLLKQANLIEFAFRFRFRGQMRYKVKDEDERNHAGLGLRNLLSTLKTFHNEEFRLLSIKWKLFEGPTDDERKRWTWILGEQKANGIFKDIELKRYENKKGMRQCKNTLEYHKFLNSVCPNESVSAAYGPWPYGSILDDFRLEREHENEEKEKAEKERIIKENPSRKRLGKGEKEWRKKKRRISKKEMTNDKIRYEQYLKERLEAQIEHLPINLENEGIRDFRIAFSVTLQKYPFLYQIMRYICPGIFKFELTNEEVETGMAYNEIERWKIASLYRIYNPTTKEKKRLEENIPDITKMLWS